jgi:Reverse transcriptase (RNA-dependent DNA polymerase)
LPPFSEEEIREALFQTCDTKALGPDEFPIIFYQHFWPIVKADILRLFQAFYEGKLQISQLNRGMVCLIPKKGQALTVKDYRPISLLNCIYKLITRVLTSRLEKVLQRLVGPTQNKFLKGRYILDGGVCSSENSSPWPCS